MRTIWKYQFSVSDIVEIRMPKGAEIVGVGLENQMPCLWAMFSSDAATPDDPDAIKKVPTVIHSFRVVETGKEITHEKFTCKRPEAPITQIGMSRDIFDCHLGYIGAVHANYGIGQDKTWHVFDAGEIE